MIVLFTISPNLLRFIIMHISSKPFLLCFFLVIVLTSCTTTQPEDEATFFYKATTDIFDWNDLFANEQIIDLQFPDTSEIPLSIHSLVVGKDGSLFIPDFKHHRILEFDSSGVLRRIIGKHGKESGELSIPTVLQIDAWYNLYVFDADGRRMTIFKAPDYKYTETFAIPSSVTQFVGGFQDDLIIYSPYNRKVIRRYDQKGNLLREALKPEQENLRIFVARFQTGGLVSDGTGHGFYTIFPEGFHIYHYNKNLRLINLLRGKISSPWRPVSPTFPKGLSPYKYNSAHQEWWDSFLHVSRIYLLSDQILAVTLFESYNLNFERSFLNLYFIDGAIIAEGLSIPQGTKIVGMGNGIVYLGREALLLEDGSIRPVQLRKYMYTGLAKLEAPAFTQPP